MKNKKSVPKYDLIIKNNSILILILQKIIPFLVGLFFLACTFFSITGKNYLSSVLFFSFVMLCISLVFKPALIFVKVSGQTFYIRQFIKVYKYHITDFESFCNSRNNKYLYIWFNHKCFTIPTYFYNLHRLIYFLKPMHYPFTTEKGIEQLENFFNDKTETITFILSSSQNSKPDLFSSKLGDYPYWDFSKDYPVDEYGKKMILLCQLNFDDCRYQNDLLPETGILQFYLSEKFSESSKNDYLSDRNQKNWRIIYHDKINESVNLKQIIESGIPSSDNIPNFIVKHVCELKYFKYKSFIHQNDYRFNQLVLDAAKELAGLENFDGSIYDLLGPESVYPYSHKIYSKIEEDDFHHILGNPWFNLGTEDPRASFEEKDKSYYDTTLLQLSADFDGYDYNINGEILFLINSEALKKKDFSNVVILELLF